MNEGAWWDNLNNALSNGAMRLSKDFGLTLSLLGLVMVVLSPSMGLGEVFINLQQQIGRYAFYAGLIVSLGLLFVLQPKPYSGETDDPLHALTLSLTILAVASALILIGRYSDYLVWVKGVWQ